MKCVCWQYWTLFAWLETQYAITMSMIHTHTHTHTHTHIHILLFVYVTRRQTVGHLKPLRTTHPCEHLWCTKVFKINVVRISALQYSRYNIRFPNARLFRSFPKWPTTLTSVMSMRITLYQSCFPQAVISLLPHIRSQYYKGKFEPNKSRTILCVCIISNDVIRCQLYRTEKNQPC